MALSKRAAASLRSLQSKVERESYEMIRQGKTPEQIQQRVAEIISQTNFSSVFRAELRSAAVLVARYAIKQAEARFGWVLTRTQQNNVAGQLDISISKIASQVVRVENKLKQQVVRRIADGIASGRRATEIRASVGEIMQRQGVVVRTLENTTRAGFQTTANVRIATTAGVDTFRLTGAAPERDFCKKHYNKVRTIAEWKELDNGQGLPVVPYLGGYNCVHYLEPNL